MKKTILIITMLLIIVWIMGTTLLAYHVDINLQIRSYVNRMLKPHQLIEADANVYYFGQVHNGAVWDAQWLLDQYKLEGKRYINARWLIDSGLTYHYDQENGQLHIVGSEFFLKIFEDGTTWFNEEALPQTVHYVYRDGDIYLDLQEITMSSANFRFGIEVLKGTEKQLVYKNTYTPWTQAQVSRETYVFKDIDALENYVSWARNPLRFASFLSIFSKVDVIDVLKDEIVYLVEHSDTQALIMTESGDIGYMYLPIDYELSFSPGRTMLEKEPLQLEHPIIMTWEAVYSFNPDTDKIPPMKGLQVVSPTWYELEDEHGRLSSKVSDDYIHWAKQNQYDIWVLVSNAFHIDRTHAFLHDAIAREAFIETMISEALKYGFKGINVDFENIYMNDKDALTHFIHELSYWTTKHGLVLSMDVTIMDGSDNWSKCYDHEKLGKIVDYLVIMAYDEHWASSPIAGPVASFNWVNFNMRKLVDVVDPSKLILGIPLYTRIWYEAQSSVKANSVVTSSEAISMNFQNKLIEEYQLTPIWDDIAKLYFVSFIEDDNIVKIWIENPETLSHKVDLVNTLNLAGVSAWRRGFETLETWQTIYDILN